MNTKTWYIYQLIESEVTFDTVGYGGLGEVQESYAETPHAEDGTYMFVEATQQGVVPKVYVAKLHTGPQWERVDA